MKRRDFLLLGAGMAALSGALPTAAGATATGATMTGARTPAALGGKNFTEQYLLSEVTAAYLQSLDIPSVKRDGMSSTVLRRALTRSQVDLCWEYVGTSLVVFNGLPPNEATARQEALERVRDLDRSRGLVWLAATEVNNSYAVAMRRGRAEELAIATLEDLVEHMREHPDLSLAFNTEFAGRSDGLRNLARHYDFEWQPERLHRMQTAQMIPALSAGTVDLSVVFMTDGGLADPEFRILDDNRGFFPDYSLVPVVRQDLLDRRPEVAEWMETLGERLTSAKLQELNRRVDVEQRRVSEVARSFLEDEAILA